MTQEQARRLLLVVGIGRSGTSVFTGILGQLGWYVPQPEVQADDTNPRGFGEPQWVFGTATWAAAGPGRLVASYVQRGVWHLAAMDSRPAANEIMDAVSQDPAVAARLRGWLADQFQQSSNVVVKDPRIVWFLPLWRRVGDELGIDLSFATMLRFPTEVITSARRSYGTWQSDASRAAAWINTMLHTEQATRDAPRAFVRYDDLLADWESQIKKIADPLRVPWLADIAPETRESVNGFVDPSLRRSQQSWDGLDVPDRVRSMIETVWDELTPLTTPGADDAAVRGALDASRESYQRFYAEVEALAHSSIHAAKQPKQAKTRKGVKAAASRAPRPTLARRVVRKVRRRLLGSR